MSSTIDKVKNALHLNKDHDTTTGTGHTGTHTHSTGTHTGTHTAGTHTAGSTNAGPHDSNMANKLDPRVDSDMDGSRNMGASTGATGNSAYNSGTTGTGMTGNSGYTGTTGSTNAGPHSSNLANKMDPRVDSDMDGSRNMGANSGTTGTGYSGTHAGNNSGGYTGNQGGLSNSTNAGPHNVSSIYGFSQFH